VAGLRHGAAGPRARQALAVRAALAPTTWPEAEAVLAGTTTEARRDTGDTR